MVVRYTFAHGTDADWATETRPLAAGEPGWSSDAGRMAIGDGNTLWAGLPKFAPAVGASAVIDDSVLGQLSGNGITWPISSQGSTGSALSSQGSIALASALYAASVAYANQAVAGVGGARTVPVVQNADGSWPNPIIPSGSIALWIGVIGTAVPPASNNDLVVLKDS